MHTGSNEDLQLPRRLVNQILAHAQSQPNAEICGLLSSIAGQAKRYYPVRNVANDTRRRYQMDGEEQIAAMRHMREQGEELLAIVHSHPHSAAEPSITDISEAQFPQAIYLIVSLDTKGVLEMRGFRLLKQDIKELDVVLS